MLDNRKRMLCNYSRKRTLVAKVMEAGSSTTANRLSSFPLLLLLVLLLLFVYSLPFNISRKQASPCSPPPQKVPLEPANRARGGHPRTAHYAKMSSKGRIELQMGVSGAEIHEKPDGDVRFCVVPQKPIKNCEKLIFCLIFPKFSERVQTLPNASRHV